MGNAELQRGIGLKIKCADISCYVLAERGIGISIFKIFL